MAAAGLVALFFSEQDLGVIGNFAIGIHGWASTANTNGVYLCHMLCNGHQSRHRAERLAGKIHVQSGNNNTDPFIRQGIADFRQIVIEELRLIYPDDLRIGAQQKNCGGMINRRGLYRI